MVWLLVFSAFLVLIATQVDVALTEALAAIEIEGDPGEVLTVAETFGHGIGVILVLVAVWMLSPVSRKFVPRLVVASLGAGMVVNVVKLCVARTRPRSFDFSADSTVWDTFGGFFPPFDTTGAVQSFPSAHSATAVGFAIALAACFPRGKWLFYSLAALTCFSRMQVGAHYLSDVLVGAAIGIAVARLSLTYLSEEKMPRILRFDFDRAIEPSDMERKAA